MVKQNSSKIKKKFTRKSKSTADISLGKDDYSLFLEEAKKIKSDFVICGSKDDSLIKVNDWITMPEPFQELFGAPGFPCGLISMVSGVPDCLCGDAYIPFKVYTKDGRLQDSEGRSLEVLYRRFNRLQNGNNSYLGPETKNSDFYVSCVDNNGFISSTKIEDVVYSGIKECFEVETQQGFKIRASKNHKFLVDINEYKKLEDLKAGDFVCIHNRTEHHVGPTKVKLVSSKDKIISIKSVGKIKTYDISCKYPYNNFIANDFVVHNSAKTTACNEALASTQRDGGIAILFLSELKFDVKRAEAMGIQVDGKPGSLIKYFPKTIEQAGEYIFDIAKVIDRAKTKRKICIVWDSIGTTPCENELNEKRNEFSMDAAKAITGVLRKTQGLIRDKSIAFIMINQIYDKMGTFFGKKTTTRGGKGPRYYSALHLEFSRVGRIRPKGYKYPDPFCGIKSKISVEKNHLGPPFKEMEIDTDWRGFVIGRDAEYTPKEFYSGKFNSEISQEETQGA